MDFVHPVEAVIPGVQGRVLAVLVDTTAELSLRTLARLGGASVAQASRVLPGLVKLGLVERREVPPSSQFRLVRSNVGARAVIDLARSRNMVLATIRAGAAALPISPASVIVFGSFASGAAGRESDVDAVSSAQVRAYAGKAQAYADAVCGARLGMRAAGDDHEQVLTLLRHAGIDGAKIERICVGCSRSRPRPNMTLPTWPRRSQQRP